MRALDAKGAAAFGDIVVLAVPLHKFRNIPAEILHGKIVIDVMNYWQPIDGDLPEFAEAASATGTSSLVQAHFTQSTIVKTLNHIGYNDIEIDARPKSAVDRRALGIATDDDQAADAVSTIIDSLGFDPVHTGMLATGIHFQPGIPLFGGRHNAAEIQGIAALRSAA